MKLDNIYKYRLTILWNSVGLGNADGYRHISQIEINTLYFLFVARNGLSDPIVLALSTGLSNAGKTEPTEPDC